LVVLISAPRKPILESDLAFLSGGGEMGALIRAHDWKASPLGPPQAWPQSLKTTIRVILNTGHPMYIWWGPELLCFYNDAYRRSIGPERHPGSLGRPGREVWEEIWPIIGPQIEQVMSGRGPTGNVNALVPITRHGRREDVYWTYSYSPIDDADAPDGVGGVLVVCSETTDAVLAERHRAEEATRASQLAAIVATSADAILTKSLEGIITSWNKGAQRLFGYTAAEAIGQPVMMLIPPERHDEEPAILARIRSGEAIEHYETVRRHKDGALIDISLSVSPLLDDKGKVTGASKIARDITEQKRASAKERLLAREMNHRIKNLFALAGGIVALSARDAQTVAALKTNVIERLNALARANDLTLAPEGDRTESTPSMTLHALIDAIMKPYEAGPSGDRRVRIEGVDLPISASATTSLALLIHELATNAAKYGALSTDEGAIVIRCAREADKIALTWIESGGPARSQAEVEEGFGSHLLRATVRGLGGDITHEWRDAGVTIHLSAALPYVQPVDGTRSG
jgi:PAS domain S-box-containing protein